MSSTTFPSDRLYGFLSLSSQWTCSSESKYLFEKNIARQSILIQQQAAWDVRGFISETILEGDIERLSILLMRLFNLECDVICSKIQDKDIDVHSLGELIEKSFYQLNELGKFGSINISISFEYFNLKLDELLILYNGANPDKKIDHLRDIY